MTRIWKIAQCTVQTPLEVERQQCNQNNTHFTGVHVTEQCAGQISGLLVSRRQFEEKQRLNGINARA